MGAKAFGVQNPTQGETAISWQTWSDGDGGIPIVTGGSIDWGKLGLNIPDEGRSAVYDLGSEATRTFTLTENRYGMGRGLAALQYRTDTSSFAQDDVLPAWTDYTVPFSVNCRYVQIREITPTGDYFYVDNAATGNNDGTSWTDAWESFADITWASIGAGDTLFISGGSTSKTYSEILDISYKKGTASQFITITVGANSPSPSGHDGMVIIDGGGTRIRGILCHSAEEDTLDYIRINGLDGNNNYKWEIRNIAPSLHRITGMTSCIDAWWCNYLYIDGIKFTDAKYSGVNLSTGCSHCRIRGCYYTSFDGSFDCAIQAILVGDTSVAGVGNIIENNYCLMRTTMDFDAYGEPPETPGDYLYANALQTYNATDTIIRNNYCAWVSGRGNWNCGTIMINSIRGNSKIYNNAVVGCSLNEDEVLNIDAVGVGTLYLWNNTIVTQNTLTTPKSLHFANNGSQSDIAAIKNNIIVSPNGLCMVLELGLDTSKSDHNCLYTGGEHVVELPGGQQKSWAEWTALGYDANGINQDPLYDAADEYRLNDEDSPCINVGADLSAYFTTDRDGNLRPTGAWDIGAYEYVA